MPFKSKSQMKRFGAMEARGELPKGKTKQWAAETPDLDELPDRVAKKKSKTPMSMAGWRKMGGACLLCLMPFLPACHVRDAMKELDKPEVKNRIGDDINSILNQPGNPFPYIDLFASIGGLIAIAVSGKHVHGKVTKKKPAPVPVPTPPVA